MNIVFLPCMFYALSTQTWFYEVPYIKKEPQFRVYKSIGLDRWHQGKIDDKIIYIERTLKDVVDNPCQSTFQHLIHSSDYGHLDSAREEGIESKLIAHVKNRLKSLRIKRAEYDRSIAWAELELQGVVDKRLDRAMRRQYRLASIFIAAGIAIFAYYVFPVLFTYLTWVNVLLFMNTRKFFASGAYKNEIRGEDIRNYVHKFLSLFHYPVWRVFIFAAAVGYVLKYIPMESDKRLLSSEFHFALLVLSFIIAIIFAITSFLGICTNRADIKTCNIVFALFFLGFMLIFEALVRGGDMYWVYYSLALSWVSSLSNGVEGRSFSPIKDSQYSSNE